MPEWRDHNNRCPDNIRNALSERPSPAPLLRCRDAGPGRGFPSAGVAGLEALGSNLTDDRRRRVAAATKLLL